MSRYAQELSIDNLEPVLKLERRTELDEIEMVAGAINDLRERLKLDIEKRSQQESELRLAYERFGVVMDSLDAAVYAVDMETYEILFINRYVRVEWGDVVGELCWKAFQADQTGPCSFCSNPTLVNDHGGADRYSPMGKSKYPKWADGTKTAIKAIRWIDGRIVTVGDCNRHY